MIDRQGRTRFKRDLEGSAYVLRASTKRGGTAY